MKIARYELFGRDQLLSSLKKTRLKGFGGAELYKDADVELRVGVPPSTLVPAQRYVLESDFKRIEELYEEFLKYSVDIFSLDGGILFWMLDDNGQEEGPIPLIPPVVELSKEPDGATVALINDGMHRVYAAKRLGKEINIVLVSGVSEQYPYYAYALPNGWDDVQELNELPDGFLKKEYRDPSNYKSLFRDFNAVFPGVQKQRKQSNPQHIKA